MTKFTEAYANKTLQIGINFAQHNFCVKDVSWLVYMYMVDSLLYLDSHGRIIHKQILL